MYMNTIIWIYLVSFLVVQIFDTCISFPSRTYEFSTPQLAQCDRPAPVPGNEGLNQLGHLIEPFPSMHQEVGVLWSHNMSICGHDDRRFW